LTCQEDSNNRLNRSLYGLCQSPRNVFQHLKSKLEAIGFESQENIDQCLFISDSVIVLVYIDNTLLFSPDDAYIDDVISKLRQSDMELEVEDSVAGFFGVHIKRNNSDGLIKLTQ
jgi:Reverse transcriptase (RNA-dependent DNA polymerase)